MSISYNMMEISGFKNMQIKFQFIRAIEMVENERHWSNRNSHTINILEQRTQYTHCIV